MKREQILITYLKQNSYSTLGFTYEKLYQLNSKRNIGLEKNYDIYMEYVDKENSDKENSDKEFKEMLKYATEEFDNAQVTIVICSVFDLDIWNFFVLKSSYRVISLLENEEKVNLYFGMIDSMIDLETEDFTDNISYKI